MKDRRPSIGDMLIEKSKLNGQRHVGLIYEITPDRSVFIKWSGEVPYNYYEKRGYSATNIHNEYDRFELVKK
jgi:hypothetical protein